MIFTEPMGVIDMHGNVWEWCWDWYGPYEKGKDPEGASFGSDHVRRGESFLSEAQDCRSATHGHYEDKPTNDMGFRIVFGVAQQ